MDESEIEITLDTSEVSYCAWVPVEEFLADPNVYAFNKVDLSIAIYSHNRVVGIHPISTM